MLCISFGRADSRAPMLPQSNLVIASELQHGSLALHPIENTNIVYRDVLFRNDLDNLLRNKTTGEGSNVVKFGATSTSPIVMKVSTVSNSPRV